MVGIRAMAMAMAKSDYPPLLNAMMFSVQIQTKCSRFLFIYIKAKRISSGSSKSTKEKQKRKRKKKQQKPRDERENLSHRRPFAIRTQHTVKYKSTDEIRMMTTMMAMMMMKAHTQVYINILHPPIYSRDGAIWRYHTIPYRKWTWEIKIRARPRPNQTFSPDAMVYFVSLCSILLFRVVSLRWLSFWVCSQPRIDSHFYHSLAFIARSLARSAIVACFTLFTPLIAPLSTLFLSILLVHFLLASFLMCVCVCAWGMSAMWAHTPLTFIMYYFVYVNRLQIAKRNLLSHNGRAHCSNNM